MKCPICSRETTLQELQSWGSCDDCEHLGIQAMEILDYEHRKKMFKSFEQEIKEMNLPALTGSPKQIAWAEKIRASFILNFYGESQPYHDAALEALKYVTDSKIFINWSAKGEELNLAPDLRREARKINPEYAAKFNIKGFPVGFKKNA